MGVFILGALGWGGYCFLLGVVVGSDVWGWACEG